MKLYTILSTLALSLIVVATLNAQEGIKYQNITVDPIKTTSGITEKLQLSMDVVITDMKIGYRQMLQVTPNVISADKTNTTQFPTLVIASNNRYKVLQRNISFGHIKDNLPANQFILVKKKDVPNGVYHYSASIPFSEWMKGSEVSVGSNITGCTSCIEPQLENGMLLVTLKKDPYQPTFSAALIAPEVEAVKARADKIEAYFNYKVARHELLKDYKNNARELKRVDDFVASFRSDANITVSDYVIEGFASPEGTLASNLKLSNNRSKTFASYLITTYNIPQNKLRYTGKGEDWDGLRKAITESSLSNKDAIVAIIDRYNTDTERESAIQKLDGGATYKKLLNDFYPPLRRNTVTVSYVVKSFSLDEALKVYRNKPNQLSLEEFFRISETFTKGSKDFIDVFLTALQFYPNNEIANLNVAAAYIEARDFDKASSYVAKAGNSAEADNNRGIIAFNKGDAKAAHAYFQKASTTSQAAASNLKEIEKYLESL